MRKKIFPSCPDCGSTDISGWYDDHNMTYNIRCESCGHCKKVLNIKYVEAFPEWFDIEEIENDEQR